MVEDEEPEEEQVVAPRGLKQLKQRHSMLLSPALIFLGTLVALGRWIGWPRPESLFVLRMCAILYAIVLMPQLILHARYFLHNRGKTFWSDGRTLWILPADGTVGGGGALGLNGSTVEKVQWVARFALFESYQRPLGRYYYWRVTLRDGRVTMVNSLVHTDLFHMMTSEDMVCESKWSLFSWY